MAHILVVEDDQTINHVVTEFLMAEHHQVSSVFDGLEAWELISHKAFDLIILDIMIPSLTGLELLQRIREKYTTPVLMLTAIDDEETQLASFNHLISDYVVKPFSPIILMKRIENILRAEAIANQLSVGNVQVLLETETTLVDGAEVSLTRTQYQLLEMLLQRKGTLVTREQLMHSIWGYDELDSRVLDNHIKNLRKKIPSLPLKTVVGRGYQIEDTD